MNRGLRSVMGVLGLLPILEVVFLLARDAWRGERSGRQWLLTLAERRVFWTLWWLAVAWVAVWLAVSALVRRGRGRPFLRPVFPDALFAEQWRSGRTLGDVMSLFGGASNCLWVTVRPGELIVGLHFPFNLVAGMDYRVPAHRVRGAEVPRTLFGGRSVTVRFVGKYGEEERLQLSLADPDGFVSALAAAKGGGG